MGPLLRRWAEAKVSAPSSAWAAREPICARLAPVGRQLQPPRRTRSGRAGSGRQSEAAASAGAPHRLAVRTLRAGQRESLLARESLPAAKIDTKLAELDCYRRGARDGRKARLLVDVAALVFVVAARHCLALARPN